MTAPDHSLQRTAFITGGTGFVGSRLAKTLLGFGWDIHLLARPASDLRQLSAIVDRIRIHVHSGQPGSLYPIIQDARPDAVYHLASHAALRHRPEQVRPMLESNIVFGTELAEAVSQYGKAVFINTGSFAQHYQGELYNPDSLYAATKQAFEDLLRYYSEVRGMRVTTLTLFDNYGAGDPRPKIMNLLLDCCRNGTALKLSPGEQLMDLVYVDDVAKAFIVAAERLLAGRSGPFDKYAVSSGNPLPLKRVVSLFEEAAGRKLPVQLGGIGYRHREHMVPGGPIPLLPEWKPEIGIEEGIRLLLAGKEWKRES